MPGALITMTADSRTVQERAEEIRKDMLRTGQAKFDLADDQGQKWTTDELRRDFEVIGFSAPYCVVRRKADNVVGTLEFTHHPRVYFGWEEDNS
jgi:hypothetical protein